MKAVILAGGLGTRLAEETDVRPKPMVEIGGRPILWHIMKIFSFYGINDFVICCGYKGYVIKEYFANYFLHTSDVSIDMAENRLDILNNQSEPWKVTLVDTGHDSDTGGRLLRVAEYLRDEEEFCFTYGDGVADVNIPDLIKAHRASDALVTLTAVRPPGRYGALDIDDSDNVRNFLEKPEGDGDWINGGFFVVSQDAIKMIKNERTSWEKDTLPSLAKRGLLQSFRHSGFWQPMDTLREKQYLGALWDEGTAPWKLW